MLRGGIEVEPGLQQFAYGAVTLVSAVWPPSPRASAFSPSSKARIFAFLHDPRPSTPAPLNGNTKPEVTTPAVLEEIVGKSLDLFRPRSTEHQPQRAAKKNPDLHKYLRFMLGDDDNMDL